MIVLKAIAISKPDTPGELVQKLKQTKLKTKSNVFIISKKGGVSCKSGNALAAIFMTPRKEITSMESMLVPRGKTFRKTGSVLNVEPPKKIFLKLTETELQLQEIGVH